MKSLARLDGRLENMVNCASLLVLAELLYLLVSDVSEVVGAKADCWMDQGGWGCPGKSR